MKKVVEESKVKTKDLSTYYIDSSDDEVEDGLFDDTAPIHKADYFNYLFKKLSILGKNNGESIDLVQHEININTCLPLLVHNFADRLFRDQGSAISKIYKTMKSQQLAITNEQYSDTLSSINEVLFKKKGLTAEDTDPSKISTVKQKIKKLGGAFLTSADPGFLDVSKSNLEALKRSPLILEPVDSETGGAKVLALTKLANRANKDMLKFLATQKMDWDTVSNYHFPFAHMKNFGHINQFHYETGKIQISTPSIGSYNDIMARMSKQPTEIAKQFVERMFAFVRAENLTDKTASTWIKDSNYNAQAEQMAYLFLLRKCREILVLYSQHLCFLNSCLKVKNLSRSNIFLWLCRVLQI